MLQCSAIYFVTYRAAQQAQQAEKRAAESGEERGPKTAFCWAIAGDFLLLIKSRACHDAKSADRANYAVDAAAYRCA